MEEYVYLPHFLPILSAAATRDVRYSRESLAFR
jgi:hypothetical protein